MANKRQIRYSPKTINFIADKIESGMSLAEVCRKYSDKCPEEKTIYAWKRKHEYARIQIDSAYQTLLTSLIDRIIDLSSQPLPDTEDKMELLRVEKERRLQLDSLKFLASKITPKLVPTYSDKVKIEHENAPAFVMVDYSLPAPKNVNVIEGKVDDEER